MKYVGKILSNALDKYNVMSIPLWLLFLQLFDIFKRILSLVVNYIIFTSWLVLSNRLHFY